MSRFEEVMRVIRENRELMEKRFGVKEIGLFGSVARGEETPLSDLDILVEFEEGAKGFDNYMDLKFFLEEKTGFRVDLILKTALKEQLRPFVLQEVVYA